MEDEPQEMRFKPLSQKQLAAIGSVTVEWSFLESQVHYTFMELLNLQPWVSRSISGRIRRIDVLLAILRDIALPALEPSLQTRLAKALATIKGLEEERNQIAHASWYASEDWAPDAPLEFKQHMQGIFKSRHDFIDSLIKTPNELKDLAKRMEEASHELQAIINANYAPP